MKKKYLSLAMVAGLTAGAMSLFNKEKESADTIDHILSKSEGDYYDWKFGRIFYTKQGNGSPILLIHDLNVTSSHQEWGLVVKELSSTNTVYTIDLLGCGNSDKPNLTYTNYLYVQLVESFIENVIKEKSDIIATNNSSSIAIMSDINNSDLINQIILINPVDPGLSSLCSAKGSMLLRNFLCLPIVGTFIYNTLICRKRITKDFESNYFYNSNSVTNRLVSTYLESSHTNHTHSKYLYASIVSNYTNMNVSQSMNKISNPISIIIGNGSPNNILIADQYQNLLPSIQISSIENAKLLPQLEVPKKLVEEIKNLLNL